MRHYIKTIMLLAIAFTCGANVQAKVTDDDVDPDEANALQVSLAEMIHKYSVNADTLAKELSAKFKHSAKMQTAIARAYYRNNDRETTRHYLDKAIQVNPKYADSYILYGKMYEYTVDTCAYWYNKAIDADPQNPEPYLGLASAQAYKDMDAAKATLERLRAAKPSYDVDAAIADLYNRHGNDSMVVQYMNATDPYQLDMNHLAKYIQSSYWAQDYEKAVEISKIAIQRFPQNKSFNRVCAWSLIPLGSYNDALKYGQEWIDSAPADSLNSIDMFTMGSANLALGNTNKGFEYFAKIAKMDDYFVPQMKQQINNSVGKIRDDLVAQKKYDEAADIYKRFMQTYPGGDEAYRLYTLSNIYRSQMLEYEGDARKPYLNKLFEVYSEIEKKYPDWENISYVLYQHARYTYSILDPENEQCLARPYYQKLYDNLSKDSNLDDNKKNWMVDACLYLGSSEYFHDHNLTQARVWWNRVLKYDPTNEKAKTALDKIKK